jgi:hypothetical protein
MDHIPPVIRLLLTEDFGDLTNLGEFARRYKKFAHEARAQAEWSISHFDYVGRKYSPSGLVITASGHLNPLTGSDLCLTSECRLKAALNMARTLGLYADNVILPDPITTFMVRERKLEPADVRWLAVQIQVLRQLAPLLKAGIVRLRLGHAAFCERHHREFVQLVDGGVDALVKELGVEVKTEVLANSLSVSTGSLHDTPLSLIHRLDKSDRERLQAGVKPQELGTEIYLAHVRDAVHQAVLELKFAQSVSSPLFTTSRRELLTLRHLDAEVTDAASVETWEKTRSIQLPWLSELSIPDIVRLREDAQRALPGFRARFAQALVQREEDPKAVPKLVAELRLEVSEIEAELVALALPSEARFRNVAGVLGMAISVFGFASGGVPPGVALGGLVSILGLLHSSTRKDEQEAARLQSKPAYVLVKARELLEHARH